MTPINKNFYSLLLKELGSKKISKRLHTRTWWKTIDYTTGEESLHNLLSQGPWVISVLLEIFEDLHK